MCGIAGFIGPTSAGDPATILDNMKRRIAHRGPDGQGSFFEDGVGLGHRRLAIVDLSSDAAQPMISANNRFALVYNGMLYNYRELRNELELLGIRFRSVSDSEVLLEALSFWGIAALSRFNGMFAFALYDRTEKSLLLARDRYGIKPLYFTTVGTTLVFGSEVKAVLAHPLVKTELDEPGLLEYFTFQNFFTSRTLFKNIRTLEAGHTLRISASGEINISRYWDFDFLQSMDNNITEDEALEELDRLFCQAVRRQLVSDVQVGAFLSGGVDSGSISAVAARDYPDLKSFTIGFASGANTGMENGFTDERKQAETMSELFGTEHYEMVLKSGDMVRALPAIVSHLEEPRVGQSYPNYFAAKLASLASTVVLSGAGGDELFGGYPWRYYRAAVNDSFESYIDKYYVFWQRLIPNRVIQAVFHPIRSQVKDVWTRDIFRDVFAAPPSEPLTSEHYVNMSLYFEAKTFLHGLLIVDDKLSMAHGLEGRVPFLDNDLVDFAMRLPLKYKLDNLGEVIRLNENEPGPKTQKYFEKTRDGKKLLRRVMERYVPAEVANATKRGFSGPDDSWFRGESIDYVRRTLLGQGARIYNFFDRAATTALVEEHIAGTQNRRLLIWSLLNFEIWCKTFL